MEQKYLNRFELKYQISIEERDNVIRNITPFMELDKNVKKNQKFYGVRSVYFDSPFRKAFFEKVNGIMVRYKLRLRYYPDFQDGEKEVVFIEIKKKNNEVLDNLGPKAALLKEIQLLNILKM